MNDTELEKMAEEYFTSVANQDTSVVQRGLHGEIGDAYIAGYKKAREWVSVKERLPEESGKYLVIRFPGDSGSDVMWDTERHGWNLSQDRSNEMFPTHWMPLPPKPEGVE